MKRFEERVTIGAPVDRVFDYVADMTTHADWSGNDLEVTKSSEGPVAVGTVYDTTAKQFGT
ncbi:MAG: SRPBCC family protein, partial [Actinomycetota bacterium]